VLREAWWWLSTPCPPWARGLGILGESCAIGARARRCADHWAGHRARCQELIAAHAPAGGRVAVLGSGSLLAVPVAALAARCAAVALVDAVHPAPARRTARAHPRLRLVTADLSGAAPALWAARGERRLPAVRPPGWGDLGLEPPDLAVSALLLSQLPLAPLGWLDRQGAAPAPAAREGFRAEVQRGHLALLRAARAWLLLTDVNANGAPLLAGIELPAPLAEWDWPVAPTGEAGTGAVVHRVRAYAGGQSTAC
jgi:hypothetical protein